MHESSYTPLIRFLLDDEVYLSTYGEHLRVFATEVFTPGRMLERYATLAALVREDAIAERWPYTFLRAPSDFDAAIDTLREQVQARHELILDFINFRHIYRSA